MNTNYYKIALFAFCMLMIYPTQSVFAKETAEDNKPIYLSTVRKENGRNMLWGLCEERYKYVDAHEDISNIHDPQTGEWIQIRHRVLICTDPGWARCRRTANGSKSTYRGVIINDDFLCSIENEMLYDIDVEMIENHKFEGEITRKIIVNDNNKRIVLLFVSQWRDGDSEGNGVINTMVYDITDQIPSLF